MTNINRKIVYIADEELARFGLNVDMKNSDISNAIRKRLDLPERVNLRKSGIRATIIQKLGLEKGATQKQVNEATLRRLESM